MIICIIYSGDIKKILNKSPDEKDLKNLLKQFQGLKWNELAEQLELEREHRTYIMEASDAENKLELVILRWISSESTAVTWKTIIKALTDLKMKNEIKEVHKYLERPGVYAKYRGKEDFKPLNLSL